MREEVLVDVLAACAQGFYGATKIDGIPKDDGGDDQVEAVGTILPALVRAIPKPAQPMEAYRPGQGVSRLSFVQPDCCFPPECRVVRRIEL